MRPIVRPPDKFWPILGLYHILNLHFPLTTFFFDAPWGRFAAQGKTWPYNWTFNGNYAWFCFEIVSPITFLTTLLSAGGPSLTYHGRILAACYLLHYFHRAILDPLVLSAKRSPSHLVVILAAGFFNLLNGYVQAIELTHYPAPDRPTFWFGIAGWAIGLAGHVYHDEVLHDLRRPAAKRLVSTVSPEEKEEKKLTDGRYAIPRGGLFRSISAPNYVCEWFEWTCWSIAAAPTLFVRRPLSSTLSLGLPSWILSALDKMPSALLAPPWAFVVFELSSMMPRAIRTHRWYKRTFGPRYPKERKAAIPGIL